MMFTTRIIFIAALMLSGCRTTCDCSQEQRFCDALLRMDDHIIDVLKLSMDILNEEEAQSLRKSINRIEKQRQNSKRAKRSK